VKERRVQQRLPIEKQCSATIRQSDGTLAPARLRELSAGGIALTSHYTCQIGREFDVYFRLPLQGLSPRIGAHCRVTCTTYLPREEAFRIGMKFLRIHGHEEEALRHFVRASLACG